MQLEINRSGFESALADARQLPWRLGRSSETRVYARLKACSPSQREATLASARYNIPMADSLYLSIWFPSFREEEMMSRTVAVLRQFPFSSLREGITYLSVHPVSWSEPTVLERRFNPGISPEEAAEVASEFAHDDFAFVFEAFWDFWVPNDDEHGEMLGAAAGRRALPGSRSAIRRRHLHRRRPHRGGLRTRHFVCLRRARDLAVHREAFASQHRQAGGVLGSGREELRASAEECCGRSRKRTWRRS